MFGLGTVLQAEIAATAPAADALRVRLLVRLARSPRWLAGAVVTLVGWALQVAALLLAPGTVVQPGVACRVVAVLVLAWAMTAVSGSAAARRPRRAPSPPASAWSPRSRRPEPQATPRPGRSRPSSRCSPSPAPC